MKKLRGMALFLFLSLVFVLASCSTAKDDISGEGTSSNTSTTTSASTTVTTTSTSSTATVYTITFESMGGNNIESVTAATYPDPLPVPVKDKYEFTGWYEDLNYTKEVVAGATVTGDITVYAKWVSYTITYQSNDGEYVTPDSDCIIPLSLPVLSRDGYTFTGWYTDEALTAKAFSGTAITKSTTLYAGWTTKTTASYELIDDTHVYFGYYPQTLVTDTTITSPLTYAARILPTSTDVGYWTDYGYYISGEVTSYMYYIDVDTDGNGANDYRGVYFTSYRPNKTSLASNKNNSYQDDNGYSTNTVYWFKYEQIEWTILKTDTDIIQNASELFVVSNLALTSTDYNYTSEGILHPTDYQGNTYTEEISVCPNKYLYSTIRNWLNTTFYEDAFSDLEQAMIETTEVDNSGYSTAGPYAATFSDFTNEYACENTNDKMFALSATEAFTLYDNAEERHTAGSDYAKCQGLEITNGYCPWWTRSPGGVAESGEYIPVRSNNDFDMKYVNLTYLGLRPACWINISE